MSEKWVKIANEYGASLFPVFGVVMGVTDLSKELGTDTPFMFSVHKGNSEYFTLPSGWLKTNAKLVELIKADTNYLRDVYKKIHELGLAQAEKTSFALDGVSGWSSKKLNDFYQDFVASNAVVYKYGVVLVLLDFQLKTFFSDEVKQILEKHGSLEHFVALTTPLQNTYGRKQDLDLLKLFAKIKKGALDGQLLENHLRKYAWVYYVYEGPALSIEVLKDMIRDLEQRGVDPEKELANIERERIELEEKQNKILDELSLTDYEKSIIGLARDAVFYKPYRRELQTWSYYNMEPVMREIARRLNLTLTQARMMLPNDVNRFLASDDVDVDLLNERLKYVSHGYSNGQFFTYAGQQAEEFVNQNVEKEEIPLAREFIGAVAYRGGIITGIVKVINTYEEISKMSDGDILVSSATSPNLMPAIRKASAIVTDEGGLTCHAAIVSRELKIPCVIGTKIATKVLKDGDLVEVDAEKGIVRKLSI